MLLLIPVIGEPEGWLLLLLLLQLLLLPANTVALLTVFRQVLSLAGRLRILRLTRRAVKLEPGIV